MTLNTIQLNTSMLTELYADVLVETDTNTVPDKISTRFLGNNKKHILVMVDHDQMAYLPDSELNFLSTVLGACKLSLADIAIVNFHPNGAAHIQTTFQDLEPQKVLLFNVDPLSIGLPINFPWFQVQDFDKRKYLFSPDLTQIEKEITLKQKLWNSLKNMFDI
ncbi:MAG: hypothetical protein ACXWB9_03685 [Flavisolibacter sp.]